VVDIRCFQFISPLKESLYVISEVNYVTNNLCGIIPRANAKAERPPLVGEVSANFSPIEGKWSVRQISKAVILVFYTGAAFQIAPRLYSRG
jgi:hypothetical protein